MVAKITLEYDDQTSPGFQQLVRNFEAGEAAAHGLTVAADANNQQLAIMQQNHAQTVAAMEQTTLAVMANRDSWVEVTNTLVEFGRNVGDAIGGLKNVTIGLTDKAVALGLVESRGAAAGLALKAVALRAAGIAAPVAAATIAYKGMQAVFAATGKDIEAAAENASAETRQMIADIKAGIITLEELEKQTGKTAEELGIRRVNNWTKIEDAAGKANDSMGKAFSAQAAAMGEAIAEVTGADVAWQKFEQGVTAGSETMQGAFSLLGDKMQEIEAHAKGMTVAQMEQREEMQRMLPILREIEAHEQSLERRLRMEKDLASIQQETSVKAVRARLEAEKREMRAMAQTAAWSEKLQGEYLNRIELLTRREIQLREETERKGREAVQKSYEMRAELRKQEGEEIRAQMQKEFELRKEALEKQKALEEAHRQGKQALELQFQLQLIERVKHRLELEGNREKEILELNKMAAKQKAEAAIGAAQTEIEKIQIRYQLEQELRELDLQHHNQMLSKKAEATKQAEKEMLEEQKKQEAKIKELAKQKGDDGKTDFERRLSQFGRRDVFEEIVRQRQAEAKKGQGEMSRHEQLALDRQIRAQAMRDAQTGRLKRSEAMRAQSDLASRSYLSQIKNQQFNEQQIQIIKEQAQQIGELIQAQERLEQQQAQLRSAQRNMHTRRRGQR